MSFHNKRKTSILQSKGHSIESNYPEDNKLCWQFYFSHLRTNIDIFLPYWKWKTNFLFNGHKQSTKITGKALEFTEPWHLKSWINSPMGNLSFKDILNCYPALVSSRLSYLHHPLINLTIRRKIILRFQISKILWWFQE